MLKSDALSQLKQLKKDIREASNQHSGLIKGSLGRFGFVVLNDGRECFLNPEEMQKVFPGDNVTAEINEDNKGRPVATLVKVNESRLTFFVGRYLVKGKGHFVEPDLAGLTRWIFIPPKKRRQAQPGDYLLCKVMQHPFKEGKPQAEVVKILGKAERSGLPVDYAIAKYNLAGKNPALVDENKIKQHIEQQIAARTDRRDVDFITIDAASTEDMDDALYADKVEGGWRLMVAIADPAEFISVDSDADKYARRLGSSYYFPDRVIPMLHPRLANGLCSLQPQQERLALVCGLHINASGVVTESSIEEAVINCKAKLSYDEATEIMNSTSALPAKEEAKTDATEADAPGTNSEHPQKALLLCLQEAAHALHQERAQTALVANEKPEFRLILDDNKKVSSIVNRVSTPAHRIIEEVMIATNRAAAQFLKSASKEALYSAHSGFRPERLEQIKTIVSEQCNDFEIKQLESWQGLKHLIKYVQAKPPELPLEAIASRLLTRGTFSKTPAPHAGMGLPEYTTFTSPIRKYADLTVHRIIKAALRKQPSPAKKITNRTLERLQESLRNGRSAVNESEHWLKCEYAQSLVGQSFDGHIQHTSGSGFQVRLDDSGIDGMVNLGSVKEKFKFDGTRFQHIGEKRSFCLNQPVRVTIAAVDMDKKQIDLLLAE